VLSLGVSPPFEGWVGGRTKSGSPAEVAAPRSWSKTWPRRCCDVVGAAVRGDNSISNIVSHLATGVTFRPGLHWALPGHGAVGTSAAQHSAAVLRRSVSFGRVFFAAVHRLCTQVGATLSIRLGRMLVDSCT
jgi:hypothetical protein